MSPDDDQPLSSEELIRRAREEIFETDDAPETVDDAGPTGATGPDVGDAQREQDVPDFLDLPPSPRPEAPPPPPPDLEPTPAPAPPPDWGGSTPGQGEWRPPTPGKTRSQGPMSRFGAIAGWVVAVPVLFFLFGQCAGSGTILDNLDIGDCFANPELDQEVTTVEVVDCNEAHDFELFSRVDLGSSSRSFPGFDALSLEVESECIDTFAGYVGSDPFVSTYQWVTFTPVSNGWEAGDRTGMCILAQFDLLTGDTVMTVGSARNSGR